MTEGETFVGAVLIFTITVVVLALATTIFMYQLRLESRRVVHLLKVQGTGLAPALSLAKGKSFHLFLSHIWRDKDVVAATKLLLQNLLPGVEVFLDVDDLASIDELEAHV